MVVALSALPALAARGTGPVVRDWGLHREWQVLRDAAHPEWPARLVEIPWSTPVLAPGAGGATRDQSRPRAAEEPPAVRAGMRVRVWQRGEEAEIQMEGTALETGSVGRNILVRAGMGNATLHGIVRGPASVELVARKGWQ